MKSTTSKTTASKRDEIQKYLGYVSDEKIDLLYEIATMSRYCNKEDLLKLANVSDEDRRKIDTAFPHEYYERIREIYPNIDKGNLCYDYREGNNSHGQMVNVNDLIVSRILKSK
mgnify:FL=1